MLKGLRLNCTLSQIDTELAWPFQSCRFQNMLLPPIDNALQPFALASRSPRLWLLITPVFLSNTNAQLHTSKDGHILSSTLATAAKSDQYIQRYRTLKFANKSSFPHRPNAVGIEITHI